MGWTVNLRTASAATYTGVKYKAIGMKNTLNLPFLTSVAFALLLISSIPIVYGEELQKPTPSQAKIAFANMFRGTSMAERVKQNELVIGTCVSTPAQNSQHQGQVSCTLLIKSSGGSSETQADFYQDSEVWLAQPSSSQDELPFPDPKFR